MYMAMTDSNSAPMYTKPHHKSPSNLRPGRLREIGNATSWQLRDVSESFLCLATKQTVFVTVFSLSSISFAGLYDLKSLAFSFFLLKQGKGMQTFYNEEITLMNASPMVKETSRRRRVESHVSKEMGEKGPKPR